SDCHGNPAFLGFGQHVVAGATIEPTLLCERDERKPLDGFLALRNGQVKAFSAITREGGRALSADEVRRTLSVNLCLVCHNRASDPIYRRRLDHSALDDRLHRRLLADK
ncbi:MAG TPA: cytochrome C, partial [Geobacterales bacterium]|nr:cytochrome C [Geobacterales bacterium]